MTLSRAGLIWNRAALEAGGTEPREGDKALAALLLLHGLVMNGGVAHAREALDAKELGAALEGFRYFGFDAISDLLERVLAVTSEAEMEALDVRYAAVVPSDDTLMQAFHNKLLAAPESFAPL